MHLRITTLTLAALLAGCAVADERAAGGGAGGDATEPPAAAAQPRATPGAQPPATSATPAGGALADAPPPAPGTEPVPMPKPIVGEAPAALVAKMRADLEQRLATAGITETPVVVSSEEVEWPDGGMGCGRPGEMHTMMIIPGYRVVFGVGPRRYTYHASRAGAFKYCDAPLRLPPPSAGRTPPSM